jgi:hypothetical protein
MEKHICNFKSDGGPCTICHKTLTETVREIKMPKFKSIRSLSNTPSNFRLAKKKDGTLILQGAFKYWEIYKEGYVWQDIPTVEWDGEDQEVVVYDGK